MNILISNMKAADTMAGLHPTAAPFYVVSGYGIEAGQYRVMSGSNLRATRRRMNRVRYTEGDRAPEFRLVTEYITDA